ncbi:OmpA family protein [Salinibius halmophilus]|uniref:OmpA family protein n=1 Tax=Salinibius halmophilus TaxID=1853216 RepID=UPI000E6619A4|nr:OmpA family protein [Salinibius halmophilus]
MDSVVTTTVNATGGEAQVSCQVNQSEEDNVATATLFEFIVPDLSCYVFFTKHEVERFELHFKPVKDALTQYADALDRHRKSGYDGSQTDDVSHYRARLSDAMKAKGIRISDDANLGIITCYNVNHDGKQEQTGDEDQVFSTKIDKKHVLLVPTAMLCNGKLPAERTVDISGFWQSITVPGTADYSEKSSVPPFSIGLKHDGEKIEGTAGASISAERSVSGQLPISVVAGLLDPRIQRILEDSGFGEKIDQSIRKLNEAMHFDTDSRATDQQRIVDLFGPDQLDSETAKLTITHENWGRIERKCKALWEDKSPVKNMWPMGLAEIAQPADEAEENRGMITTSTKVEKPWADLKTLVKNATLPPINFNASGGAAFLRYAGTATGKADFNPLDGNLALSGAVSAQANLAAGQVKGKFMLPNSNGFDASVKFKARAVKHHSKVLQVLGTAKSASSAACYGPASIRIEQQWNRHVLVMPRDVLFSSASSEVSSSDKEMLNVVALELQKFPHTTMTVIGHTDEIGTCEDNMALSRQRAQAVYDYLVSRRIAPHRLTRLAKGEESPRSINMANQGLNRRVELKIDQNAQPSFFSVPENIVQPTSQGTQEAPLFKRFSCELTTKGLVVLRSLHEQVINKIKQSPKLAAVDIHGEPTEIDVHSLSHSNDVIQLAMTIRTFYGDEVLLPKNYKEELKELRYKVVRQFLAGKIDFPGANGSANQRTVMQLYQHYKDQYFHGIIASLQRLDNASQYANIIEKPATDDSAVIAHSQHLQMFAQDDISRFFFNNALPYKASAVADTAYHKDKNVGTQLALSIVQKSFDGFTEQKQELEFEFGFLRVDYEGVLSAAVCAKASLSAGVHMNTGKALLEQKPTQEEANEVAVRTREVNVSLSNQAAQAGTNTPSAGAKASGEVFVGVEASAGFTGSLLWHPPIAGSVTRLVEGDFKALGSIGCIATVAAGLGAAFDLQIGFDGDTGKFIITFKAKLVAKVGGGGQLQAAVDVAQIHNFYKVIYEQLKRADFRVADIFESANAYLEYSALYWGAFTLADEVLSLQLTFAEKAAELLQEWIERWADSKDGAMIKRIVERCTEENIEFIQYAPPEVLGNWIWMLMDQFFFSQKERSALLFLLTKGISTRREFNEVLEHCLESPHAEENEGRTAEDRQKTAHDAAEDIRKWLFAVGTTEAKILKQWFEGLEGEQADNLPRADWLDLATDYLNYVD